MPTHQTEVSAVKKYIYDTAQGIRLTTSYTPAGRKQLRTYLEQLELDIGRLRRLLDSIHQLQDQLTIEQDRPPEGVSQDR